MSAMPFLPRPEITTLPEPARITFQIEREHGWIEWPLALAGIGFCFWQWSRYHLIFWAIGGTVATASAVANWARGSRTELVVTADELLARGNTGRLFSSEITIRTADVTAMQYQVGDEGAPSGLYVRHGWRNTCLVRGISEDQTNQILDEISRRFPNIRTGDSDPSSLLFGSSADLTRLNLR
jgi:hypothetical protein